MFNLRLTSLFLFPIFILILPTSSYSYSYSSPSPSPSPSSSQFFFDPSAQSISLIDLLSNSSSHSKLLYLIQRARLVPTINLLNSSTLFAPTNDAIDAHPTWSLISQDTQHSGSDPDNLQLGLRATLLYHLLNYTLPSTIPTQSPLMLETLLFPHPENLSVPPRHPGDPPEDKPIRLLGDHGQKLRIIQRDQTTYLGVDESGKDGVVVHLKDSQIASNGVLISIDQILTPPPRLSTLIRSTPHLSTLSEVLSDRFLNQLDLMPHLTIFAPHNDAWSALDPIELSYLKSNFSAEDAIKVFQSFSSSSALSHQRPAYYQQLYDEIQTHHQPVSVPTTEGASLSVDLDPSTNTLTVNGTKITQADVLANNGVLHVVPSLLLPHGSLLLSPEKYLLALNCTRFVSLFRSANLSSTYLANSTLDPFTILAPRDDVLDGLGLPKPAESGSWRYLPANDSQDLRDALKYHLIRGKHAPENLDDGMLLSTELGLKHTSGSLKQQIAVSVSANDGKGAIELDKKRPLIGFGGVNVVGVEPVQVGNWVIYVVSQIIERPSDLLQTALSDIRLSTCVASVFAAGIDSELREYPGLSYFTPTNKAFQDLGLIMDYLLLGKSKSDLARVLRYHAVQEVVYLSKIPIGNSRRYPTLEGNEIYISKADRHNITLHGPTSHGLPLNGETRDSEVLNRRDRLIETGSLNVINQVELPSSLAIDIAKLMAGAKASTMVDLIKASNMSWILHNDPQPDSPTYAPTDSSLRTSYTVLCPSDEAFTKINLTYYLQDPVLLKSLILQHIIPVDPPSTSAKMPEVHKPAPFQPLVLEDGVVYSTLLSRSKGGPSGYGDVSLRINPMSQIDLDEKENDKSRWLIGIKGARGTNGAHDSARVINYGRVTPKLVDGGTGEKSEMIVFGGGVLSLNMVLEPYEPNWWERWGKYTVAWIVVVGFGSGIGFLVWKLWIKKRQPNSGYQYVEPMEE